MSFYNKEKNNSLFDFKQTIRNSMNIIYRIICYGNSIGKILERRYMLITYSNTKTFRIFLDIPELISGQNNERQKHIQHKMTEYHCIVI